MYGSINSRIRLLAFWPAFFQCMTDVTIQKKFTTLVWSSIFFNCFCDININRTLELIRKKSRTVKILESNFV